MMRTSIVVSAAFFTALAASPAAALTPSTPNPMSAKYRDAGAKPATGRSGSAAIETRALLGLNGSTDLEVTTGQLDGGAPAGTLAKVQIKLLTPDGLVMQTDNYRKTIVGNGYASFSYDYLQRGQDAQVQANVTGIDPNRTDVVTVATQVKLRPDIEAASLNAPAQALVNTQVVVSGVMAEINGDVGARATCRLFVDGVEVAAIPGAWVDANSSVTCQFQTSFSSAGTKQVAIRVTDVVPGDYDPSNNEVARSIEVIADQQFNYMHVWASEWQYQSRYRYESTWTLYGGSTYRHLYENSRSDHWQQYGAYGTFHQASALDSGQITLRHANGGDVLGTLSFSVVDLPNAWGDGSTYGCRGGSFTGVVATICSYGGGFTQVWIYHEAGEVTYVERSSSFVDGVWYWNYDYSRGETYGSGFITFGSTYTADLRHEANGNVHQSVLDVALNQTYAYDLGNFGSPYCSSYDYPGYGLQTYCYESAEKYRQFGGSNQRYY